MEQNDKNKWVEEVINSLDGIDRAEPNAYLYGKIENRLAGPVLRGRVIPLRTVWLAAACILLLVLLNILLLNRQSANNNKSIQEVANYYQLTNNNPLYNL